ncbi:hypothetical protein [Streptomyces sp. NPDC096132]|uniref:hypothetical protein n=1 Tax=Streptomyces sp. NPDC096132 TaxID=3366075 RepID=UPI003816BEFA
MRQWPSPVARSRARDQERPPSGESASDSGARGAPQNAVLRPASGVPVAKGWAGAVAVVPATMPVSSISSYRESLRATASDTFLDVAFRALDD